MTTDTLRNKQTPSPMTYFYEKYEKLIYKKAHEVANDPNYVDDLVQDALCQILRNQDKFSGLSEEQQVAYCMAVIRNTAINHHNRLKKIRFISEDSIAEQSDPTSSMEETVFHQMELEQFRQGMEQLDEVSRSILTRKYLLFEPDESIAADLNIKPASVRMMLTRAKRKLKKLLLDNGFDPELL